MYLEYKRIRYKESHPSTTRLLYAVQIPENKPKNQGRTVSETSAHKNNVITPADPLRLLPSQIVKHQITSYYTWPISFSSAWIRIYIYLVNINWVRCSIIKLQFSIQTPSLPLNLILRKKTRGDFRHIWGGALPRSGLVRKKKLSYDTDTFCRGGQWQRHHGMYMYMMG